MRLKQTFYSNSKTLFRCTVNHRHLESTSGKCNVDLNTDSGLTQIKLIKT